jgi:pimeloyl-ACP methyl ester carboxylesterase
MPPTTELIEHRNQRKNAAVVFVHGFTGKPENTWTDFAVFLSAEKAADGWDLFSVGYSTNLRIDLAGIWSADPDLEMVATLLHTTTSLRPLNHYEALAIIAHSMGGLAVQRALLDHADLTARAQNVILFGTPSGGLTKAGLLWRLKRQLRDMVKGGEFVTKLRKDWSARFTLHTPFQFTVVAGENDEFVPYESSLAPFDKSVHAVVAGNHLEIIRPRERNHRGVQLVVNRLSGGAAQIGPWDGARLAVEGREFQKAIDLFEPHQNQLDDTAAVQLAIALEKSGRQNDAIDLLRSRGKPTTDAMGTLAGRLKRRWLRERREDDATRAIELYSQAYGLSEKSDPMQAYYSAINIAFMKLVFNVSLPDAQIWARRALEHCSTAAKTEISPDAWRFATEGEANLLLGNFPQALQLYRESIATQPDPWQLESMYMQALEVARQLKSKQLAADLAQTFNKSIA